MANKKPLYIENGRIQEYGAGDTISATIAPGSGGGGGGGGGFGGISGVPGSFNGTTYPTKGLFIVPHISGNITEVFAIIDPYDAATDQYYAQICEVVESSPGVFSISDVLATSPTVTSASADVSLHIFDFTSSTPAIVAETMYAILIVRVNVGRNTNICPVVAGAGVFDWPGDIYGRVQYAERGVSIGNINATISTSTQFYIWVRGITS